jgi:hypothetical protein
MNTKNTKPSIELLNSEGAILKAVKTPLGFAITDQKKEVVEVLSEEEIFKFTRGEITITDSLGRVWDYSKQPGSMKPNLKKLDEFIGVDINGKIY